MKLTFAAALAALLLATPAHAERLQFDHRLVPALKDVLDSGDSAMVEFDNRNPARLVDLIAVKGKSARNWSEALEIISIVRPKAVADAKGWMELLQRGALERCPGARFELIASDDNSVTYQRRSPGCRAERAETGLYRLVAGKRSWFQLAVLEKGPLGEAERAQWLALLASAHLD